MRLFRHFLRISHPLYSCFLPLPWLDLSDWSTFVQVCSSGNWSGMLLTFSVQRAPILGSIQPSSLPQDLTTSRGLELSCTALDPPFTSKWKKFTLLLQPSSFVDSLSTIVTLMRAIFAQRTTSITSFILFTSKIWMYLIACYDILAYTSTDSYILKLQWTECIRISLFIHRIAFLPPINWMQGM